MSRDRQDVEKRIKRLVEAIETGGDVPTLVTKLRELEAKRASIEREIACSPCRDWSRESSTLVWPSGDGCCASPRRRAGRCCSACYVDG
jgi:hypothetical protein